MPATAPTPFVQYVDHLRAPLVQFPSWVRDANVPAIQDALNNPIFRKYLQSNKQFQATVLRHLRHEQVRAIVDPVIAVNVPENNDFIHFVDEIHPLIDTIEESIAEANLSDIQFARENTLFVKYVKENTAFKHALDAADRHHLNIAW